MRPHRHTRAPGLNGCVGCCFHRPVLRRGRRTRITGPGGTRLSQGGGRSVHPKEYHTVRSPHRVSARRSCEWPVTIYSIVASPRGTASQRSIECSLSPTLFARIASCAGVAYDGGAGRGVPPSRWASVRLFALAPLARSDGYYLHTCSGPQSLSYFAVGRFH